MPAAQFPRARRLSGKTDFGRVFREGRNLRSGWLTLVVLPNERSVSRFGCTVRRQAFPRAVDRNRIKRWCREAFRRNQQLLPSGFDLVVLVVRPAEDITFQEVEKRLIKLSQHLVLQKGSS